MKPARTVAINTRFAKVASLERGFGRIDFFEGDEGDEGDVERIVERIDERIDPPLEALAMAFSTVARSLLSFGLVFLVFLVFGIYIL